MPKRVKRLIKDKSLSMAEKELKTIQFKKVNDLPFDKVIEELNVFDLCIQESESANRAKLADLYFEFAVSPHGYDHSRRLRILKVLENRQNKIGENVIETNESNTIVDEQQSDTEMPGLEGDHEEPFNFSDFRESTPIIVTESIKSKQFPQKDPNKSKLSFITDSGKEALLTLVEMLQIEIQQQKEENRKDREHMLHQIRLMMQHASPPLSNSTSVLTTEQNVIDNLDSESTEQRKIMMSVRNELLSKFNSLSKIAVEKIEEIKRSEKEEERAGSLATGVQLPNFHGNIMEFPQWKDSFDSLVHNNKQVSQFYKFSYLKQSMKGSAAECLNHIELKKENYAEAYKYVCERYGKNRWIVQYQVRAIRNLMQAEKTATSSRLLYDHLHARLRDLNKYNPTIDMILLPIFEEKLPKEIRIAWEREIYNFAHDDNFATCEQFLKFFEKEVCSMESAETDTSKKVANEKISATANKVVKSGTFAKGQTRKRSPYSPFTTQSLMLNSDIQNLTDKFNQDKVSSAKHNCTKDINSKINPLNCAKCKKEHELHTCPEFLSQSVDDRLIFLLNEAKYICRRCLIPMREKNHLQSCKVKCTIENCLGKHNYLIHKDRNFSKSTTTNLMITNSRNINAIYDEENGVILPTVKAILNGKRNIEVCIAMDSCSEKSYIEEDIVKQAGLIQFSPKVLSITGFGGHTSEEFAYHTQFLLKKINGKYFNVTAIVKKGMICTPFSPIDLNPKNYSYLQKFEFCDSFPRGRRRINILLGVEYFFQTVHPVICEKQPDGLPYVIKTPFGYTIGGPYVKMVKSKEKRCLLSQNQTNNKFLAEENLNSQLEKFWNLDSIGISDTNDKPSYSCEEIKALEIFNESFEYDGKRYQVALPFKSNRPLLKSNYSQVRKQLESIEKSFLKNKINRETYSNAINEYVKLDFAFELNEKLKDKILKSEHYFVPHHPVFKNESSSTKVRIVFNASSADQNGNSLNSVLLTGPTLHSDIGKLLLKFRTFKIGVSADIRKMFCQTRVIPDHHRYQLYMWRDCNQEIEPKIFAMKSLMFGVKSSPFLAMYAVQKHANKFLDKYPTTAQDIINNIYVDDYFGGGDSIEEISNKIKELVYILSIGGWELTQFSSNSSDIIQSIPKAQRSIKNIVDFNLYDAGNDFTTTLGLWWNIRDDTFRVKFTQKLTNDFESITKRKIASRFSAVYDIFRYVSAYVIIPKILMQKLWQLKLDWDDTNIPSEIIDTYQKWEKEIPLLEMIKIPRWIGTYGQKYSIQLHGFADASEKAYGAVVYARIHAGNSYFVHYIMAKTRDAPLRFKSIARLELLAAHNLVQLMTYIKDGINQKISSMHYWSDSAITLAWLQKPAYNWKTFVRNRVQEIQEKSDLHEWRFISGKNNPADMHSRGVLLHEIIESKKYWHGPEWLELPEKEWPIYDAILPNDSEEVEKEKPKNMKILVTLSSQDTNYFSYTHNFDKLVHIFFRIRHWLYFRCSVSNNSVYSGKIKEMQDAENNIWRLVQQRNFHIEYENLRNGQKVPNNSKILAYSPVWDEEKKLIISKGRLIFADLPETTKYPIILPDKHEVVEKLILTTHQKNLHSPINTTIAILQEKYVIVHFKQIVRNTVKKCLVCQHYSAKTNAQIMGPLPPERVAGNSFNFAFTNIGIDFTGPLWLKDRSGLKFKVYILIASCATSRLCHLEITSSMTTEDVLSALRRMFNRKGLLRVIISDNALYFKKCAKVLEKVAEFGIDWQFIVERAPHQGGFWERINRSIKEPLRKVLHKALLSWVELETVLTDIERTLNQRALTLPSSDPQDSISLTPAHLSIGRSLCDLPPKVTLEQTCLSKRYIYLRKIQEHFWKRWQREYLPTLIKRQKWKKYVKPLSIGDICLLSDNELIPKNKWRLGRIIKAIPGRDGIIRTYVLQTEKGEITRPINRLLYYESGTKDDHSKKIATEENGKNEIIHFDPRDDQVARV